MKKTRFLIIGYGSIGKKHYKILSKDKKKEVFIYTKQKVSTKNKLKNITDIAKLNPEFIIVCSRTENNFQLIKFIEKYLVNKTILIEKPLSENFLDFKPKRNQYFVGYNLRFHPLIILLKKKIKKSHLLNISIKCHSYLPHWRKNIKYNNSNSALKKSGGVINELSHELDILLLLSKKLRIDYVYKNKISDLKIQAEDILIFNGTINKKIPFQLSLNFFSKIKKREILIDGKNFSCDIDILNNKGRFIINNRKYIKNFPKYSIDKTYEMEYLELQKRKKTICSFQEGLEVTKLIKKIKNKK